MYGLQIGAIVTEKKARVQCNIWQGNSALKTCSIVWCEYRTPITQQVAAVKPEIQPNNCQKFCVYFIVETLHIQNDKLPR